MTNMHKAVSVKSRDAELDLEAIDADFLLPPILMDIRRKSGDSWSRELESRKYEREAHISRESHRSVQLVYNLW